MVCCTPAASNGPPASRPGSCAVPSSRPATTAAMPHPISSTTPGCWRACAAGAEASCACRAAGRISEMSGGNGRNRHRGTTLIEALVALLVLAFGMASVARVQTHLRLHADIGRQRTEAVRLAQEDVEAMRAFAVVAASAGTRAWADIASAARTVDATSGLPLDTVYRITRAVAADAAGSAAHASVTVAWNDRRGDEQH